MGNLFRVLLNVTLSGVLLVIMIKVLSKVFDGTAKWYKGLDKRVRRIVAVVFLVLITAWPIVFSSQPYILRTSVMVLIYIVLALSLNIVMGFAGQLSMGHAAFYGIGAYTTALMTVNLKMSFWIALPVSAIVAAIFGFILGLPTLRLKGDYLAITTIGFGEIIRLVLINWIDVTRGPAGIPGIPSPKIFGMAVKTNSMYFYIILVLAVIAVIISRNLLNSRLGRGLMAVKDDEAAAEAMGVNSTRLKVIAFVLSAAIAGIAGSFFASFVHYVNPDNFTYNESVSILCMVVLGGLSSVPGVLVGATVLTILPEALRDVATYRYVIYGMLLVFMMIIRPQGMISINIFKGGEVDAGTRSKISNKILRRANSSK